MFELPEVGPYSSIPSCEIIYVWSHNRALVTKHTHTHNRFTAGLEYVRVHPGQQVPER